MPAKKNKFPKSSYKAILGADAELITPFDKALNALKKALVEKEKEESTKVDYAILADGDTRDGTILVCTFRADQFYTSFEDDLGTVSTRGGFTYQVIGAIDCGDVRLTCSEDTFMSFAKVKNTTSNELVYDVKVKICDDVKASENEAREALKAEKKQAKRHRRRVTASTVTSPSEHSMASSLTEADEDVKARQRERNKAKKKAQKERRQARASENEDWKKKIAALKIDKSRKTNDADNNDGGVTLQVLGDCGSYFIVRNRNTGKQSILPKPGYEILDSSKTKEKTKTANRKPISLKDSSGSESDDSSDTEAGGGLQILQLGENATPADITRIVKALAGSPVMVASPEEEPEERENAISKGLKYLGRGL